MIEISDIIVDLGEGARNKLIKMVQGAGLSAAALCRQNVSHKKTFGPDVKLGNVTTDAVIETETTRLGIGSAGPLALM